MNQESTESNPKAHREKIKVAITSIIASVVLTIIKLVVGTSTNSLGILSEAMHSGLDVIAALMTFYAIKMAMMPMGDVPMSDTQMQGESPMDEKMKMEEMNKMMMEETQNMLPGIMIGSFVSHVAFGAALGLVVTPIVRRASIKSEI